MFDNPNWPIVLLHTLGFGSFTFSYSTKNQHLNDLIQNDIENSTWMHGDMKFISSVQQVIEKRVSEIYLLTTQISFIFPSIHVLFCLLYKNGS